MEVVSIQTVFENVPRLAGVRGAPLRDRGRGQKHKDKFKQLGALGAKRKQCFWREGVGSWVKCSSSKLS